MTIERKYERDVDLLLAEEFDVNPAFAERFKGFSKFADRSARVVNVWVSRSNELGESDLVIVYQCADGECVALLIEDKVDAPLQPDQALRYRLRAEQDRANGAYGDYEVLLCAPRHYIGNRSDLNGFDRLVSFEQIAEIVRRHDDRRAEYRAAFLETAATRRLNTWSRRDDPATNQFWDAAYELATREFPLLEIKRPQMTEGSTWFDIRPHDLPTQPKRIYIRIKGDRGQVDLTFSNTSKYLFEATIAHLLDPDDMSVQQTGASAAIRIEAPSFSIADGVAVGLPKVKAAFEASSRLIRLYRSARGELDQAAKAATPEPSAKRRKKA